MRERCSSALRIRGSKTMTRRLIEGFGADGALFQYPASSKGSRYSPRNHTPSVTRALSIRYWEREFYLLPQRQRSLLRLLVFQKTPLPKKKGRLSERSQASRFQDHVDAIDHDDLISRSALIDWCVVFVSFAQIQHPPSPVPYHRHWLHRWLLRGISLEQSTHPTIDRGIILSLSQVSLDRGAKLTHVRGISIPSLFE